MCCLIQFFLMKIGYKDNVFLLFSYWKIFFYKNAVYFTNLFIFAVCF